MTVEPSTTLDLEALRRGYEEWDVEALLALYADDVELIQIDRDNPPSSPRLRHGKEVFRGMFEHCAARRRQGDGGERGRGRGSRRRHRHLRVPRRAQGRRQRGLRAPGGSHCPRARCRGGRSEGLSHPIACDSARKLREFTGTAEQEVENAEGIEGNRFRA